MRHLFFLYFKMPMITLLLVAFSSIYAQEPLSLSAQVPPKSFERSFSMILHSNLAEPEALTSEESLNKEMQRYRKIAYEVLSQTPDARTITFHFYDDDSINAFAIPGGFIFITKGMLNLKLGDEEIAHLLGHEIAHLVRDHHIQRNEQSVKSTFATILLSLALSVAAIHNSRQAANLYTDDSYRSYNNESVAAMRTIYMAPAIANYILTAKYTREMERDADLNGRKYASLAGYSKLGAESLFTKLSKTDNQKISILFRTHPYMHNRASAAHLAENIAKSATAEIDTIAKKTKIATSLISYIYYYESEQNEILSKTKADKKIDYILLYANAINKLAQYALAVDASIELNDLALKAILKQELLKQQLSIIDNQWGMLASLYEKHNVTAKEFESVKQNALIQKDILLKAIRSKNAGIPTCRSYLINFENSDEIQEVQFALLSSFLIVKDFISFEYFFQNKAQSLVSSSAREKTLSLVESYIKHSKKPFQLYNIVNICKDEKLEKLMKAKLPELIKPCQNLKEIYSLVSDSIDPEVKSMISKEKLERIIEWNFSQAKFLEKEQIKNKALELYNEILIYTKSEEWKEKAQSAIDTLAFE